VGLVEGALMAEFSINETNWTEAAVINEIVDAINERREAIFLPVLDTKIYPVKRGDDIQLASFWNGLLTGTEETQIYSSAGLKTCNLSWGDPTQPLAYISIEDNLQAWMALFINSFIPYLTFLRGVIAENAIESSGEWTDPVGCGYSERLATSGAGPNTPALSGETILISGIADDYMEIDGTKLNARGLMESGDVFCANGVIGFRNYRRNIVCGTYSASSMINWNLWDTKRGAYHCAIDIGYAPSYTYYPIDTSGWLHA